MLNVKILQYFKNMQNEILLGLNLVESATCIN